MSKPVVVAWGVTAAELEGRYRAERDVERRKRLGALWRVRAADRVADAGWLPVSIVRADVGEQIVREPVSGAAA